jgi:hypothetical protein
MALAHRGIAMNKDNAKDYLPLVQALADGKMIQVNLLFPSNEEKWRDSSDVEFCYPQVAYRIKPEPKEIWVNQYPNGVNAGNYASRLDAYDHRANDTAIQVRYREVIE